MSVLCLRFGVDFTLDLGDDRRELMHREAARIDLENQGERLVEYTDDKAFVVCWHHDAEWLVENKILRGWTVNDDLGWRDDPTTEDPLPEVTT